MWEREARVVAFAPEYRPLPFMVFAIVAAALVGCISDEAQKPIPLDSGDPVQRVRNLVAQWQRCLDNTYAGARKQKLEAAAAADFAFNGCSAEESELEIAAVRAGAPPDAVARRRAELKRGLLRRENQS